MKRSISAPLALLVLILIIPAASAYEKGGIAFILDHGKELNLTDFQKRELNTMRSLEERTRTKIFAEADVRPLIQKAIKAKLQKDDATATQAYVEVVQKVIEKSLPVATKIMEQLGTLLTPEQLARIEELKEKTENKQKVAADKSNRNDPAKPKLGTPPPNPFEF